MKDEIFNAISIINVLLGGTMIPISFSFLRQDNVAEVYNSISFWLFVMTVFHFLFYFLIKKPDELKNWVHKITR